MEGTVTRANTQRSVYRNLYEKIRLCRFALANHKLTLKLTYL